MWARLKFVRDRVHNLHKNRESLILMDKGTKETAETYKHVTNIVPNSTKVMKQSVRNQLLKKVGGHQDLVLFNDNGRLEQERREMKN